MLTLMSDTRSISVEVAQHPVKVSEEGSIPPLTAWAIGIIEGEGCFSRLGRVGIGITVQMTDEDVIARLQEALGGTTSGPHSRPDDPPHYKPVWHWRLHGDKASEAMKVMYPWMSARRKERINEVLSDRSVYDQERETKAEITEKALRMRADGISLRTIAKELGVNHESIRRWTNKHMVLSSMG